MANSGPVYRIAVAASICLNNSLQSYPMKFTQDCETLLAGSGTLTGDAARIALRLSRAIEIIENNQAAMEAVYADIMKRYDEQAGNRLLNQIRANEAIV